MHAFSRFLFALIEKKGFAFSKVGFKNGLNFQSLIELKAPAFS